MNIHIEALYGGGSSGGGSGANSHKTKNNTPVSGAVVASTAMATAHILVATPGRLLDILKRQQQQQQPGRRFFNQQQQQQEAATKMPPSSSSLSMPSSRDGAVADYWWLFPYQLQQNNIHNNNNSPPPPTPPPLVMVVIDEADRMASHRDLSLQVNAIWDILLPPESSSASASAAAAAAAPASAPATSVVLCSATSPPPTALATWKEWIMKWNNHSCDRGGGGSGTCSDVAPGTSNSSMRCCPTAFLQVHGQESISWTTGVTATTSTTSRTTLDTSPMCTKSTRCGSSSFTKDDVKSAATNTTKDHDPALLNGSTNDNELITDQAQAKMEHEDDGCSIDSVARIKNVPVATTTVAANSLEQLRQQQSQSASNNNNSWSSCQIPSHLTQIVHVCANHKKPRKLLATLKKEIDTHHHASSWKEDDNDHNRCCLGIIFFAKIKTLKYMAQLLRQEQQKQQHKKGDCSIGGIWELHSQLNQQMREAQLDAFQNSANSNSSGSSTGRRRRRRPAADQSPSKRQRRHENEMSSSSSSSGKVGDGGGSCSLLLATDLAARGLDISNIRFVIQYDFPGNLEQYIHRCGRGGRDAQPARIYSFFTRNLGSAMAASVVQLLRQVGGEKAQWVDPNLQELATGAVVSAPIPSSNANDSSFNEKQEQQSQSPVEKNDDDDDNDDAFAELSGSRIVLQRSSHVSDPSDDDDDAK